MARELRAELQKIQEGMSAAKPETQEANIDEETMRRLASLGYIGGTMATKKSESKVLADPKDMLHLYNAVGVAARHITDKEFVAATAKLEGVLKEDPQNPQARFLLAMCYEKTDRNADAKAILDGVLKDEPENLRGLIAMAGLLAKEGEDRRDGGHLQARAREGRPQHAGIRAARRRLHGRERLRRRRCRTCRRRWRSSPSSRATATTWPRA